MTGGRPAVSKRRVRPCSALPCSTLSHLNSVSQSTMLQSNSSCKHVAVDQRPWARFRNNLARPDQCKLKKSLIQDAVELQTIESPLVDSSVSISRRQFVAGLALLQFVTCISRPEPASAAADNSSIQRDYDSYAASYDDLDGGSAADLFGFNTLRAQLLATATGNVVEVAVGTGLNLQYYKWGQGGVQRLQALDLSSGMLQQAKERVTRDLALSQQNITFQQADATQLPLPDDSADCVVDTFSLCVISDPLAALKQMARVVKPEQQGGRVLLLEHTRSTNPLLGFYQDWTAETVAASSKGCYWNQDVPALLSQAGLTPTKMEKHVGGTVLLVEAVRRG